VLVWNGNGSGTVTDGGRINAGGTGTVTVHVPAGSFVVLTTLPATSAPLCGPGSVTGGGSCGRGTGSDGSGTGSTNQ
jgi:hypothetical protein